MLGALVRRCLEVPVNLSPSPGTHHGILTERPTNYLAESLVVTIRFLSFYLVCHPGPSLLSHPTKTPKATETISA